MMTIGVYCQVDPSRKEIYPAISGVLYALIPVLAPYSISLGGFNLSFSYVIIIVLSLGALLSRRRSYYPYSGCAAVLAGVLLFCTLVSFYLDIPDRSIMASLRVAATFLVISVLFWKSFQKDCARYFIKSVYIVAILASFFSISQFCLTGLLGISIWDGVLPLPVTNQDSFMSIYNQNMGTLRPRSFFQEVSYLAIYLAPVFLHSLSKKKWSYSILFGITLALSSSFLGVAFLLIGCLVLLKQITASKFRIHWGKIALVVVGLYFASLAVFVIYTLGISSFLVDSVDLVMRRIESIAELFVNYEWGRSSAQLRLLGNIEIFSMYTLPEALFGVGMDQYSTVFASYVTTSYGSALVNMLLNCGLVGAIALIAMVVWLGFKSGAQALPFVIVFALCLVSDNIVFDAKFFYLVSWVLITASLKTNGLECRGSFPVQFNMSTVSKLPMKGASCVSHRMD